MCAMPMGLRNVDMRTTNIFIMLRWLTVALMTNTCFSYFVMSGLRRVVMCTTTICMMCWGADECRFEPIMVCNVLGVED